MYCSKCGNKIYKGMKYCRYCGVELTEITEAGIQSERINDESAIDHKVENNKEVSPVPNTTFNSDILIQKSRMPFFIGIGVAAIFIITIIVLYFSLFSESAKERREIQNQLSLAERYLGDMDYERAVAAYKAVLNIDPNNSEALEALEDTYVVWADSMGQNDQEAAQSILEAATSYLEVLEIRTDTDNASESKLHIEEKLADISNIPETVQESSYDSMDIPDMSQVEVDSYEEADQITVNENSVNDNPDAEWKNAYLDYIKNRGAMELYDVDGNKSDVSSDKLYFCLIYLDNDNIPEIVCSNPVLDYYEIFGDYNRPPFDGYIMSYHKGNIDEFHFSTLDDKYFSDCSYIPFSGLFYIYSYMPDYGDINVYQCSSSGIIEKYKGSYVYDVSEDFEFVAGEWNGKKIYDGDEFWKMVRKDYNDQGNVVDDVPCISYSELVEYLSDY